MAPAASEVIQEAVETKDVASALTACAYLKVGEGSQYMYLPQDEGDTCIDGVDVDGMPTLGHAISIDNLLAYGMRANLFWHATTALVVCRSKSLHVVGDDGEGGEVCVSQSLSLSLSL